MSPRKVDAAKAKKPTPRPRAKPKAKPKAKAKAKKKATAVAALPAVPAVPELDYELLEIVPPADGKPLEWPPGLNSEKADALFRKMEAGVPVSIAPGEVGLVWKTVYRWMKRYKDFAERVNEACLCGYQARVDQIPGIASQAFDKDSAAAARVKMDGIVRYLQLTAPHRYAVKQINHGLGGDSGAGKTPNPAAPAYAVGIILLPVKESGRGAPASDTFIEGVSTVITLPAKEHLPAPPRDAP